MTFRNIVGLLIVLLICSCSQHTTKSVLQIKKDTNEHRTSQSGLLITDEGLNGINFTDSLGSEYLLRYIRITITNDSTIPIDVQIPFFNEYDHPNPECDKKFKLLVSLSGFALNEGETRHSMINVIPDQIEKPIFNEIIEPGKKLVVSIGTLIKEPGGCWIVPRGVFSQRDSEIFQVCNNKLNPDKSTNPRLALVAKLAFSDGQCILVPNGQVSYPEH